MLAGKCWNAIILLLEKHWLSSSIFFGNEEADTGILREDIPYCVRIDGEELGNFVRRYYEMEEELDPRP